jgi:hypothetical protein
MSQDNTKTDPYSSDEKLRLVALGLMDPKEIGVTSAEEAQLKIMPDAIANPVLGDPINFRCSEVPLQLRALWAKQDSKIANFDQEAWIEEHKHAHLIQGEIRSGNMVGRLERTVTEPLDGMILCMEDAVAQLKKVRQLMKAGTHDVEATASPVAPETENAAQS